MSSGVDQAKLIADRVAKRMVPGTSAPATDIGAELAAMRATLGELQKRLVQIESKVGGGYSAQVAAPQMHSPWLAGVNASHPSQERFGVEEATVSELVDYFQSEKACSMEPGGKPCDHCSMCSSRGF
jgi:hypothetical protein